MQDAQLHGCVGCAATAKGPKAHQHSRPEVEGGQAIQVISPSARIGGEQHEGASQRATLACRSPTGDTRATPAPGRQAAKLSATTCQCRALGPRSELDLHKEGPSQPRAWKRPPRYAKARSRHQGYCGAHGPRAELDLQRKGPNQLWCTQHGNSAAGTRDMATRTRET